MKSATAVGLAAILALGAPTVAAAGAPVTTAMRFADPPARVPASVSVLDQEELDRRGIETIDQLQVQVPSFVATETQPGYTLRGIGAAVVGPASEPGFAVRQSGVRSSRLDLAEIGFFDLERVELVRGPQGTLYGRNTAGGVLSIVPRRPEDRFAAGLDVEYGSFDSVRLRSVLNAPLPGDRVALRVAVQHRHHDAYYRLLDADRETLGRDDTSLRASLAAWLSDALRFDLAWTFSTRDAAGSDKALLGSAEPIGMGGLLFHDFGGATPSPREPRRGNENARQRLERTLHFGTAALQWRVADFTLTLSGGYQSHDASDHLDADHSALDLRSRRSDQDVRAWSSDLEILFQDGGPFRFAFGAGYFDERNKSAHGDELHLQQTAAARGLDGVRADVPDRTTLSASATNRTFDTFADGSYQMFERLRIRGGIHLSYTHRDFADGSGDGDLAPSGDATPPLQTQRGGNAASTWRSLTWRAGVDFDLTADNLLYALVATGNRPGGFDYLADSYKEEEVLAVELGSKNSFFSDRLRCNLAGFHYDYTDIQARLPTASGRRAAANIPGAEIWGVETEWLAEPLHRLLFNGTLGWLKTRYDQDFTVPTTAACRGGAFADACPAARAAPDGLYRIDTPDTIDLKGRRLSNAPPLSVNAGVEYGRSLTHPALPAALRGTVTARFDYTYRAETFFDALQSERYRQGPWDSGDVRLIYDKDFASWGLTIEGFVRNLWNESVKTNVAATTDGRHEVAFYNAPRTYGFRMTTRWR